MTQTGFEPATPSFPWLCTPEQFRAHTDRPQRFEYRLTEKGRDLYPVVISLMRWGDRWMTGQEEPPVKLVHRRCGHAMTPEFVCPECGEAVHLHDVKTLMSPASLRRRGQEKSPSLDGD